MKRPMLYWIVLFILGEIVSRQFSMVVFIAAAAGLAIVLFCKVHRKNRALICIGMLFFLFGVFWMNQFERIIEFSKIQNGTKINFSGTVLNREETELRTIYTIKVNEFQREKILLYILMDYDGKKPLKTGSRIIASGTVNQFEKARNPGEFDEKEYWLGKNILFEVENTSIKQLEEPVILVRELLRRLQEYFADIYRKLFEEKQASLAIAMVLGDKTELDAGLKQLYQRNGIAHLIAISGLHIAMIGGMLYQFLRKIFGSYSIAAIIGILFIVLYGIMTGLSGATLRAIIMLITLVGADVFGRRYDAISAIAFALFIMLVNNPYQITQAGFLLSFGAVIGIAMVAPMWKSLFPDIPKWMDGFFVSISVQFVLFPILCFFFYEVPVYSILLNVIVVPLMSILLFVLLICAVIGGFQIEIAFFISRIAQIIFGFYEMICNFSEKLPFHTFCMGKPDLIWIIIYYLLLAVFVWLGYNRYILKQSLILLGLFALTAVYVLPTSLLICMFDVGQGDAIYIRTPKRTHILFDGGSSTEKKVGNYILKNGLKYYGCNELDYVFISHSDSDHYSGILELFEEKTMQINNVVLPAIANPDETYMQLVECARKNSCQIFYMKEGQMLQVDGVSFNCLNPKPVEYDDKNTGSLVLQMVYREFDMLLTGDMDRKAEMEILSKLDAQIDVLKVAHHGSATSTSEAFLQKIQAVTACISVGERNRYGHPAKEVINRLKCFVKRIYLTKDCGAITIESDGYSYQIATFLSDGMEEWRQENESD